MTEQPLDAIPDDDYLKEPFASVLAMTVNGQHLPAQGYCDQWAYERTPGRGHLCCCGALILLPPGLDVETPLVVHTDRCGDFNAVIAWRCAGLHKFVSVGGPLNGKLTCPIDKDGAFEFSGSLEEERA